jgi:hypothetical protein
LVTLGAGALAALVTFLVGAHTSLVFSEDDTTSPFLLYQALADAAVNDTKNKTASKMQSAFFTLSNDCFLIHPLSKLIFSLIQFQAYSFSIQSQSDDSFIYQLIPKFF